MVAMILIRTLHKDITRYNHIDFNDDIQEEFGWKLVHGDVFRPPKKGKSYRNCSKTLALGLNYVTLFAGEGKRP